MSVDFYALKTTQIKMMRDRGFTIPPDELRLIEKNGEKIFDDWFNNRKANNNQMIKNDFTALNNVYVVATANRYTARVEYITKPSEKKESIGVEVIKSFVENIIRYNESIPYDQNGMRVGLITDAIAIYNGHLSSDANKYIITNVPPGLRVQTFNYKDLMIPPTEYVDAPKYRLIVEPEKKALMESMKVNIARLPNISINDPVVRYYNWPEGSLIQIERKDIFVPLLNPNSIQYRVVIKPSAFEKIESQIKK